MAVCFSPQALEFNIYRRSLNRRGRRRVEKGVGGRGGGAGEREKELRGASKTTHDYK